MDLIRRKGLNPLGWIGIILACDQLSKLAATALLPPGPVSLLGDYLRLTLAKNPGGAFGIFSGHGEVLAALTVGVVGAILFLLGRRDLPLRVVLGLAAIAGGALGNLIDRIRLGYVVDFLDLGVSEALRWPTFNLADVAIVLGTAALIWHLFRQEASS